MKEKLIVHLIVKSVNGKNIPVDLKQWAIDLKAKKEEIRLLLNYLAISGELRMWEEEGIEYVSVFGNL